MSGLVENIGRKVNRKKDEANDPSCYNHVVSHPSSVKVWGFIAANGDGNLYFCRDTKMLRTIYTFLT